MQYAKRVRGNKIYGGQSTHIPLRVNSAGMIPLIFAMSMMLFPGTVASYFKNSPGLVGQIATFIYNLFNSDVATQWDTNYTAFVGADGKLTLDNPATPEVETTNNWDRITGLVNPRFMRLSMSFDF